MAFAVKNSRYLNNFKLTKLIPIECIQKNISGNSRHYSACLLWSQPSHPTHNYSTCTPHQRLLTSHLMVSNHQLGLLCQRLISTDNHEKKLEQLAKFNKEHGFSASSGSSADTASTGTAKVLFVDTPELGDTATDIIDKAGGITEGFGFSSTGATSSSVPAESAAASSTESLVTSSSVDIATDIASSSASVSDVLSAAADLAEPSLASLGLASSYTPVGLVQQLLELMHINSYVPMPWWLTIVAGTVIARTLMFPIFIKAQKNAAKFAYVMPQLQVLQAKFNEARRSGNSYEAMKCATEISKFMKTHEISPLKNALLPMAQLPVFLSYFLALRGMAKLPVESMKIGGFSWITDLTIPDPFYIMPLCACSTLYVVLKVGADSGMRLDDMKLSRYFLMAMPVILFPFCINFPSAVLFYWCTNNFLTLGLVLLLKVGGVREYFGIPQIRRPDQSQMPKKKGFVEGIKEAVEDQRALRSLEERRRIDEMKFRKAGTGPIPRTYSYDPTKPRPAEAAAAAAKMHSKTKS